MSKVGYSAEYDPAVTAKAMAYEIDVSPKHCIEILNFIKGKKVSVAKTYLENVIEKKQSIPFKRFARNVGHKRHQTGWDAGRYPVKASKEILKLLKHAEANAEYKGLEPENMKIVHAVSKKGRTIQGIMPRAMGRATAWNKETVTVEVVIGE
ncbi:50S ribosomal protein L22 [Methanocella sp. CWC-04]|uniref:Large ribosomal subunit protein uL22 n=1 Tax=Methanooceanicella nereidis TaxID=2052831 RepID=A0AAP2R9R2_9EURY|nr:50S ribosomal protein L22 [Methanocella sp. CWC-04]MCD1293509.1 50S ribosomal protein L22 [Methanocella sp. CWC-04]